MIENIFTQVANWTINFISTIGYGGIIITMAAESALIPLPSEIIMPFSGFLVTKGVFNFWLVGLSGAVGNLIGSLVAYTLGYWAEEPLVRKLIKRWGKFIFISEDEYDKAKEILQKYGNWVVFGSRILPAVRTVISLPCGVARLPIKSFIVYTFLGSFIWSVFLAYLGKLLGENWHDIGPYFRKFDILIVTLILVIFAFYVYKRLKTSKTF